MRLIRSTLVAATVAALAATTLPADARIVRPVELTAVTVVEARSSGTLDVVLPEDAVLDVRQENNPDVTISGSGRFVGIELTRKDDQWGSTALSSYRQPAFLGGKTLTYGAGAPPPQCEKEVVPGDPLPEDCTYPEQKRIVLLQGYYRLQVLTDGAPLTITLRLHGLDPGETTVRPSRVLKSVQKPLPPLDAFENKIITYGATGLSGRAHGWIFATAKLSKNATVEVVSHCARQDPGAPPPFAYDSRCRGGRGGSSQTTVRAAGQEWQTWSGFVSSGLDNEAPIGLGGAFKDTNGATLGQTLGVWLEDAQP
ncbi:MAG TPA: hypothetical protein VNA30_04005 [Mycobacteriales bacterium]|nr:hypothetical protein [Mycobacteriales bacterium]